MKTQFGPFTPQDLERFVSYLGSEGLSFEIRKDEKAEREFSLNDGQNAVTRADLRTEIYLAQIFYVDIDNLGPEKLAQIQSKFGWTEDVPKKFRADSQIVEFESEPQRTERLNKSLKLKRNWAGILFLLIVIPMLLTWVRKLFGD